MNVKILKPKTIFGKATYKLLKTEVILAVHVPKGFITDGATVPRVFWPIFPPISMYLEATVLHDYLISIGANRYEADKLFRKACTHYKVGRIVTTIMFYSVVAYGFIRQTKDYIKH
jgi:hypothetical protein